MPDDNDNFDELFAGNAPVEPNAAVRAGASGLFEVYRSFLGVGFNEAQAMQMVIVILTRSI